MRRVLIAALSLLCFQACADEGPYLSARSRAIATVARLEKTGKNGDALFIQQERELLELEKKLRPLVGDVAVAGFASKGKISLETLSKEDVGFSQLDGLVFAGDDGKSTLLVTTKELAQAWLRAQNQKGRSEKIILGALNEALQSDRFYTFAISPDAAVSKYADVDLNAPPGAEFASAMLDTRSQDLPPLAPDELTLALVKDGRVYIISAPAQGKIEPIPARAKDTEAKAQAKLSEYQASKLKNEKLFDEYTALENKRDDDNRKCFADLAKGESFFSVARGQAQALLERIGRK
jgi:hypothetical protein